MSSDPQPRDQSTAEQLERTFAALRSSDINARRLFAAYSPWRDRWMQAAQPAPTTSLAARPKPSPQSPAPCSQSK
ncbi:hypothetical protein AURDEDRAFT_171854 [Auricularia subglabra TFB-10046 SS5]|uniref:Uncharacterized protein n=1 Tax=Auricularia subglabra (strain TFB-10046 / SS5) TaxID=717982 RepID=J0LC19_AURST|nr:hypothetical protein AURDEDRAFT_176934 [Auricularia subglabra TFB-10046 SS5]EJD39058.1 hypothetical protein AURDEDRAFT_171854 [Auricularia subglabra TFB-10046 SS5]